jgi:hypothetical protein
MKGLRKLRPGAQAVTKMNEAEASYQLRARAPVYSAMIEKTRSVQK